MSVSESDQLLAQGAPVTLSDGRILHLRYGMRGIKHLEDAFGSTKAIDEALTRITTAEGKSFTDFSIFMAAGLIAEGLTPDEVDDLIDMPRFVDYASAIVDAITQAFGSGKEAAPGKARNGSRGKPGTTRQPSSTDAAKKPSGG